MSSPNDSATTKKSETSPIPALASPSIGFGIGLKSQSPENNDIAMESVLTIEPSMEDSDKMDVDPPQQTLAEPVKALEADDDEEDPIQKMRVMEILPDLFNLLHDLQNGVISAKDFDNNAGSLRLKLATLRQYLQEVEGINESIKSREAKIESLRHNNAKRYEFLSRFQAKVAQGEE
ncbi:RNA polymerase II transcription mediator complex subunit 9-domain-containing protein [Scheffersomyces xylosifermentans]|uniref:RNA polymerase II transcription mediator complex subunit 9-domain-containing protein n=1 Tax=Scheffersomyces xylosifermentans TaxID=1304137 RepID=UPI00315D9B95